MNLIRASIQQPVTVTVGVILLLMAGLVALSRIPIQLTPTVDDTIIAVTTLWEGASPEEVEQEIVDKQEERLQGIANVRGMTSESRQGAGVIRLEFTVGTDKAEALREVSDKLRQVPSYPDNVDEPVVEASDPQNKDYIAWIILGTEDSSLDIRTLQDFVEDRIKPALERIPGVSDVGVLGGRERETQVRFDPVLLAQRGVTPAELVNALRGTNVNVSAGELNDSKNSVRLRTISRYESIEDIQRTVIKYTTGGPVLVGDVAQIAETYKEAHTFVRSKGRQVLAINAQREVGSNVIKVMGDLRAELARLNAKGNLLDTESRRLKLTSPLTLSQVYDQTIYIDDALALVRENIYVGGALAILVLLIFLRSTRVVAIIAVAIPISLIGAIVFLVALGRTINVISLAGMAFAVGMVVDDAIVVLENTFRHLEMGKRPFAAAYDAAKEVWGAVLSSTLTTVVVFVPILMIQEEAGQLFRDIALAICAAIMLSLVVSITVVPCAAARMLKPHGEISHSRLWKIGHAITWPVRKPLEWFSAMIDFASNVLSRFVYRASASAIFSLLVVSLLTAASLVGTWYLIPPSDYLPTGNRNLVFGMLIPPPGYGMEQQAKVGERVEATLRPYWEANDLPRGSRERAQAEANLPEVATFDMIKKQPGPPIRPSPMENYFFVAFDGIMFHGGISADPARAAFMAPLFNYATRAENAPGIIGFATQVPLFQLGGTSGSAVKIDFAGDDLAKVTASASAAYARLGKQYGYEHVQPSPGNFNLPGPELQVVPNRRQLADLGMTPADLGLAVQSMGDGAIVGEYRKAGDAIDLTVIAKDAVGQKVIGALTDTPLATPAGPVVPLSSLAEVRRVTSPPQINRVNRQRAVTLQFTAPPELPLEKAISDIDQTLQEMRASGAISPDVDTGFTGSASKLKAVKNALLGDGTLRGMFNSSLFLALVMTYLLMCVLFQSFTYPFVIMFSVPLATLGGFAALRAVNEWSLSDPLMPDQKLDVLAMLGFVILIGTVVKNAILIVHQALNFMHGISDVPGVTGVLEPRRAIAESVRTRLRPILMTTLTTLLGLLPLVVMSGAGSELYRGLGAVVLGGLLVSTIFTLVLVPLLMNLMVRVLSLFGRSEVRSTHAEVVPAMASSDGAAVASNGAAGSDGHHVPHPRRGDERQREAVKTSD